MSSGRRRPPRAALERAQRPIESERKPLRLRVVASRLETTMDP
jgi:hypothetical protein